jgi:hypothetical protein
MWLPTGGVRNGALDLAGSDGSDDYVAIPNVTALQQVQTGSYSLAAWARPDSIPSGSGAANNAGYGIVLKAGAHLGLMYRNDQQFEFDHWLSNGSPVIVASSATYAPGSFHHVAAVVDRPAGLATLYIDGLAAGSTSFAANAAVRDYGTTPWRIGISVPNAGSYRWAMDGAIDDVRIYDASGPQHHCPTVEPDGDGRPIGDFHDHRGWHRSADLPMEAWHHHGRNQQRDVDPEQRPGW